MSLYALRTADGKYLRRAPNRGLSRSRRSLVDTLDEATLWSAKGPAKLAACAAAEDKALHPQVLELVEVAVAEVACVPVKLSKCPKGYGYKTEEVS